MADSLETQSDAITSYVRGSDAEWPFVTEYDFEIKGEHVRENTQTEIFAFCPILATPAEKGNWSDYSVAHRSWLQQSYDRVVQVHGQGQEESNGQLSYVNHASRTFPELVYRVEGDWRFTPENSPGPWMPLWQISPPPPDPYPINFNTLSIPGVSDIMDYFKNNKVPVMTDRLVRHAMIRHLVGQYAGSAEQYHDDIDPVESSYMNSSGKRALQSKQTQATMQSNSNSTANAYNEQVVQGHAFVLFPVYDGFENSPADRKLTAVLISLLRWDWVLSDLMHDGTGPIIVVLENSCGEGNYTYSVLGTQATFYGVGDLHDPHFEGQVITQNLTHLQGISMDGGACGFTLRVYPTYSLQEMYTTDQATVFTTIMALAFALTALFFLFYVRIVQRRQAEIMAAAARTNAIVTSLFPSNVRDRIMRDAEQAAALNKPETVPFIPGVGEAQSRKLKTFLDGDENKPDHETQLVMFKTKPIADLFPETTVM